MGSAGCKRWERPIRIVRTPLGQLGQPVGSCIRRLSEAVAVAHGRKASHEIGMYKSAQSASEQPFMEMWSTDRVSGGSLRD